MYKYITLIFISLLILYPDNTYSQNSPSGNWKGNIEVMNMEFEIFVTFSDNDGVIAGTIDIPQQNARGLELSQIEYNFPDISFTIEVPGANAMFKGEFKDPVIEGEFEQAGMKGNFSLNRIDNILHEELEEVREPVGLKPYLEEEVEFYNGDLKFAGTLSIPLTDGKHPAVVLITGSGPQDRDENIEGFKIFGIIADHLTSNGIAVLRYDDRGVGGSDGYVFDATTTEFAEDVAAAVDLLRNRDEIDKSKIGLIGHSEGGIVAPIVAANDGDIAFIVLMAGTGVTGKEIILEQTRLIAEANQRPEDGIKRNIAQLTELIELLEKDDNRERFEEIVFEMALDSYLEMSDEQKASVVDSLEMIGTIKNMLLQTFENRWIIHFIFLDPTVALEQVKCDVLILFGGLDLQVAPHQNEAPMIAALQRGGNERYTVVTFENANHLFQEAITGSPNEYSKLPYEFIDGFLDTITNWIWTVTE